MVCAFLTGSWPEADYLFKAMRILPFRMKAPDVTLAGAAA